MGGAKLLSGVLGFVLFSLLASVVYIINDIRDRENDRHHPAKCKRPIAAGIISVKNAGILALFLLGISLVGNIFLFSVFSTCILGIYLVINLLYSYGLKNYPIIDVAILVSGFGLRVWYGAIITDIEISNWLYLTVIALSFYFALGKRRNELRQNEGGKTRKVLRAYSVEFLDKGMVMFMTLSNAFYALWSMDKSNDSIYNNEYLIFTVPCIFLITMKYGLDIEEKASDGDPVEVLLHDRILLGLCIFYLAVMIAILYF